MHRPVDGWPTWVLSNHDNQRHRTRYGVRGPGPGRRRAAAHPAGHAVPLRRRGARPGGRRRSPPTGSSTPAGRDGCRAPIPWDAAPGHGWPADEPWLPWPPDADARNVESLIADEASILHLYRRLLDARRNTEALRLGELTLLDAPEGVLRWTRTLGDERRLVLVNFTDDAVEAPAPGSWTGPIASDSIGEGQPYSGVLGPDQAVLLLQPIGFLGQTSGQRADPCPRNAPGSVAERRVDRAEQGLMRGVAPYVLRDPSREQGTRHLRRVAVCGVMTQLGSVHSG